VLRICGRLVGNNPQHTFAHWEFQANQVLISRMESHSRNRDFKSYRELSRSKMRHPESPSAPLTIRSGIFSCLLLIALFSQVERAIGGNSKEGNSRDAGRQGNSSTETSSTGPQCETTGTWQITISCTYTASPAAGSVEGATARVVLNRAVISFIPSDESHMRVELTFTNDGGSKIAGQRMVYLAIDDERGENHMRRSLPHVDFSRLDPGGLMKFQETLLAPAFSPGTYVISIWIPSTEPSMKFNPAQNFLLSSNGVPDPATGLNQIAKFTVTASARRKSRAKPD
jgi:hypothetical protein